MIRWKQKDYLTLGRAVAKFNKKINELQAEERKLYLPDLKSYKEVKSKIYTRNELNRVMASLRRFSKKGAETPVVLKDNTVISKWQQQELGKELRIAKRGLTQTISELEKPISFGYSRAQMGSEEYREAQALLKNLEAKEEYLQLNTRQKGKQRAFEHKQALAQIRNIKDLEIKQTGDFIRLKDRLEKYGSLDYKYMKASIFRENWEASLSETGVENFKNYEILKKKLDNFSNPQSFFKFISQSNIAMDLFVYYKPDEGLVYGDFASDEERFDKMLEELGLL